MEVQSKYELALSKYNTHLHDDEIMMKVDQLIEKHLGENNNIDVKKEIFHCIDLTTLKCTDSEESVMKFTEKVNEFVDKYPDLENVAAICVYPNMAEIVSDSLEADNVKIACVSGGFPSSQTFMEVKIAETAMAIHAGAEEIDIVMPVGKFLCGEDLSLVYSGISGIGSGQQYRHYSCRNFPDSQSSEQISYGFGSGGDRSWYQFKGYEKSRYQSHAARFYNFGTGGCGRNRR